MTIPNPPPTCPKCDAPRAFWLERTRAQRAGATVQVVAHWRCAEVTCGHVLAVERTTQP